MRQKLAFTLIALPILLLVSGNSLWEADQNPLLRFVGTWKAQVQGDSGPASLQWNLSAAALDHGLYSNTRYESNGKVDYESNSLWLYFPGKDSIIIQEINSMNATVVYSGKVLSNTKLEYVRYSPDNKRVLQRATLELQSPNELKYETIGYAGTTESRRSVLLKK